MIERYLQFCWEHPKRLVLSVVVLTVLLSVFTFGKLDFNARREALFKATPEEVAQRLDFEQRFGTWKTLILVVEGGQSSDREALVGTLADFLTGLPGVTDVRCKIELPGIDNIGLYFLTLEELSEIDASLSKHSKVIQEMCREGWYGFLGHMRIQGQSKELEGESRERFAEVWQQAVEGRGVGALDKLFPAVELPQRSFYTDGRNRHLVLFRAEDPIDVSRAIKEFSKGKLPGEVRIVLTGQPLLQALQKQETIRDAIGSTILAILLVQILLIWGFREKARPRLAFLSLVFGLFWSVAWAALVVGALNIITVNFLSITVGLGVDFSIHILARYTEEKVAQTSIPAMTKTLQTTGVENMVGALATSVAFLALALTDFQAVQQLGLITGVAVPLCFVSVVSTLPPLLFWREQSLTDEEAPIFEFGQDHILFRLEKALRQQPTKWLLLMSVATLMLGAVGSRVGFDYNLLNLQSAKSEPVRYEREGQFNSLTIFVVADSPAEARDLVTQLKALELVSEVHSVAELIPDQVVEKRPLVQSIVKRAQALPQPQFQIETEPDWKRLERLVKSLGQQDNQADWVTKLKKSGPGPVEDVWRQMQSHLKLALNDLLGTLQNQDSNFEIETWKKQAPELQRLSNLDGKTLIQVRCKRSLWERAILVDFTDQVLSVTSKGMGPPFLIRNYLEQLRQSYFDAIRYAILVIVVLLALHFRALTPTFIALVPKFVGAVGMFGAMGLAGVHFNPANCMALPLTLGIGLVFGIHAVHRCLESPDALLANGGTGKAIALSGLTTVASFGTLMAASNPGIYSLGFVMAAGVTANMVATFLFVPPLVESFRERLSR